MFFKKWLASDPFEPDLTRVRLYNGDYYNISGEVPPTYHIYTLCEWDEGWDSDFAKLATECALTMMEDYPLVINHLRSHFVGKSVREYPEIQQHLLGIPWHQKTWGEDVVTLSHGPDRGLAAAFEPDDHDFQMDFYGFKRISCGEATEQGMLLPDIEVHFGHYNDCLIITTLDEIDNVADKLRPICEKYGRALVVQDSQTQGNEDC